MNAATTTPCAPVHPVIRHADGRRTQQGKLSFFTIELNRLGNWKSENYFDVPAEDLSAGFVTGYRCAAELLQALERGDMPPIHLGWIIRDAISAGVDPGHKPGRRGASMAFIEIMVDAFKFMAKHGKTEQWMGRKIGEAESQRDYWAKCKAEERADFLLRMNASRQAKRKAQADEVAA